MDRFKDFQLFNSTVYKGQKKLRNVKSGVSCFGNLFVIDTYYFPCNISSVMPISPNMWSAFETYFITNKA
ncbi:MAG: hypothetical protein RIS50_710 [Bacteroidota bacterium]